MNRNGYGLGRTSPSGRHQLTGSSVPLLAAMVSFADGKSGSSSPAFNPCAMPRPVARMPTQMPSPRSIVPSSNRGGGPVGGGGRRKSWPNASIGPNTPTGACGSEAVTGRASTEATTAMMLAATNTFLMAASRGPILTLLLRFEQFGQDCLGARQRCGRPCAVGNTARHGHARLEVGRRLVEDDLRDPKVEFRVVLRDAHRRRQLLHVAADIAHEPGVDDDQRRLPSLAHVRAGTAG